MYQETIDENTRDMENITCLVDYIFVMSPDADTHEKYLFPVLQWLRDIGATLNIDKCQFFQVSITFVVHKITGAGIRADDENVKAIRDMPHLATSQSLGDFWA